MAQPEINFENYSISKLTPDDGLSQGSNYFRFEDSKGFMWITCNDAVNRYDGQNVKVYNLNTYFNHCPNLQQGYGFAEDPGGNLYIGSTRGLYIYQRKQDNFILEKIFTDSADEVAMPIGYHDGKIWCFNRQYEIAVYDVLKKQVTFITKLDLPAIESVHIYQSSGNTFYFRFPFLDANGDIWMVTENSLGVYSPGKQTFNLPIKEYSDQHGLTFFSAAYDTVTKTILLGTQHGIINYDIEKKALKHTREIKGYSLGVVYYVSTGKEIIAISVDKGLAFTNSTYDHIHFPEAYARKKIKNLLQFSFDKNNRLWVCDDGLGQIIFDFNPSLLEKEPDENSDFQYLSNRSVYSIAQLPDGNILINNDMVQNQKDRRTKPFHMPLPGDGSYRGSTDASRKGLWLFSPNSTFDTNFIYFLDEHLDLHDFSKEANTALLGQQQDLQVLPNGRVICSFDKGLYWLNAESKRLSRIPALPQSNPFKINVLSHNRIAVSYLNNDMLLAGLHPDTNVSFIQKILPGVQSFYMAEDTVHKRYWVGTNTGMYLLDKEFMVSKLFDANNGLAGTYIYGVLLDAEGNVWCSHQRGLSSIDAGTFQITNYDKSDGIQDWDFNNRAFFKALDGTLYFGGVTGFNYFKPPLKHFSYYNPEVYVDEILVNGKVWLPDTNANEIQKLNLAFSQNNISFKALIKDLANARARKLIYRIAETDSLWTYLPSNGMISFNRLAPGSYSLELGIYDKFENIEIKQKTVGISIAFPFYYKTWFWALVAFILGGLLFGMFSRRNRIRQKIAFQQQLALKKQREKITADLHDDIGASLSSLQVNSAVASQLSHHHIDQARVVLEKIEVQSKNLSEKIGDIIWSMKPGKDEFMTMSSRIRNFINDILSSTDMHYEVQIDKEVDTLVTDITARKNIVLITKEAVNNVAKYSKASHVYIGLKLIRDTIELTIKDDGIGFIVGESSGNGISNMKKRAEELNGTFDISSGPGNGTCVTVRMPHVPSFSDNY